MSSADPSPVTPSDWAAGPVSIYLEDFPDQGPGNPCVYTGLEVVHDNVDKVPMPRPNEGPQVSMDTVGMAYMTPQEEASLPAPGHWEKMVVTPSATTHGEDSPGEVRQEGSEDPVKKPRPWWRRKRYTITAALAMIAAIVGAVVGGVVSSRDSAAGDDSPSNLSLGETPPPSTTRASTSSPASTPASSSESTSSTTSKASATPTPVPILPLAAVAWPDQKIDRVFIFLASQSDDGELLLTSRILEGADSEGTVWKAAERFQPDTNAENATSLAINMAYKNSYRDDSARIQVTYIDPDSKVQSLSLDARADDGDKFEEDKFGSGNPTANDPSHLGMSSGWMMYQGDDELLQNSWWNEQEKSWESQTLNLEALPGTQVVMVPLTMNSTVVESKGEFAIIAQDKDGLLFATPNPLRGTNPKTGGDPKSDATDWPDSWPDSFPGSIKLRPGASFAAFAQPRKNDRQSIDVNCFILYQDQSSTIKLLSTENGEDWKLSSPDVFKGADENTSITCIPMLPWYEPLAFKQFNMDTDVRRCYFYKSGAVVEVQLKDGKWRSLGSVTSLE